MDGTFIQMYQLHPLNMQLNAIVQLLSGFGPSSKTRFYSLVCGAR